LPARSRRAVALVLSPGARAFDPNLCPDIHASGFRFFAVSRRTLRLEQSRFSVRFESALDPLSRDRLLDGCRWHQPVPDPPDDIAETALASGFMVDPEPPEGILHLHSVAGNGDDRSLCFVGLLSVLRFLGSDARPDVLFVWGLGGSTAHLRGDEIRTLHD